MKGSTKVIRVSALSSWMVKSQSWFFGFLTSVGVCLALSLLNGWMSGFHPGNPWGIGYGIAASVLLLGALFYGARSGTPIQEFYEENLAAVMSLPRPRLIYFVDITGGIQSQARRFKYLRKFLTAEEQTRLDELESLFMTKVELDAHYTLQRALRWWLYSHIPFSLILAVLVAFHVFSILYY